MRASLIRVAHADLLRAVMNRLHGRVFHATSRSAWKMIQLTGYVLPKGDGQRRGPFGSYNAYFRNRDCVSVYDLASPAAEEIEEHLSKCHPITAVKPHEGAAYLILRPEAVGRLLSWRRCNEERAFAEMVVPYVEAGHPGPISLADIEEAFEVELMDYPENLLRIKEGCSAVPTPPAAEPVVDGLLPREQGK
jgi:hypothetical protein